MVAVVESNDSCASSISIKLPSSTPLRDDAAYKSLLETLT